MALPRAYPAVNRGQITCGLRDWDIARHEFLHCCRNKVWTSVMSHVPDTLKNLNLAVRKFQIQAS